MRGSAKKGDLAAIADTIYIDVNRVVCKNLPTSNLLSNETSRYINPYADQVGINTFIQIWTVAIALVGTVGNIMIIAAVALHNSLRNIGNLFIVNLAVADLGVSVVVNLASVAGSITSEEGIFIKYEWLCEVIAVVCIVT
nr:tyramine receptor 1-like [Lytechinus pictus]